MHKGTVTCANCGKELKIVDSAVNKFPKFAGYELHFFVSVEPCDCVRSTGKSVRSDTIERYS